MTIDAKYDYQRTAVTYAVDWIDDAKPGDRLCLSSPTGTGKTSILVDLQSALVATGIAAWIVTPRVEILAGFLRRMGLDVSAMSEAQLLDAGDARRVTTPLRLRNRLLRGDDRVVDVLLIDEVHHFNAESYQQLDLLLGQVPLVGVTATPYRGTPKGTAEFRRQWGDPVQVITIKEAAARGVLSLPTCRIVPVMDDDLVSVEGGEFVVKEVESATLAGYDRIAGLIGSIFDGSHFDRPTMVSLPSTDLVNVLASRLPHCVPVIGSTPYRDRQDAFRGTLERSKCLLQIAVVGEGVDLPIRRLIDLSPVISPVRWMQQLGRITRPVKTGEPAPEYICGNRNLLRHAYLLEGCVPPSAIAEAVAAFGGIGKRAGLRAVGLEGLGRFKGVEVPLAGGAVGLAYSLASYGSDGVLREYFALTKPELADVLWATRSSPRNEDATRAYGKWERCDPPDGVEGYRSLDGRPVSEKQLAWWKRSAGSRGLDADAEPNRKNFVVLPVLTDLRERIEP